MASAAIRLIRPWRVQRRPTHGSPSGFRPIREDIPCCRSWSTGRLSRLRDKVHYAVVDGVCQDPVLYFRRGVVRNLSRKDRTSRNRTGYGERRSPGPKRIALVGKPPAATGDPVSHFEIRNGMRRSCIRRTQRLSFHPFREYGMTSGRPNGLRRVLCRGSG